jgi:type I restriction enzyme S subunit
VINCQSSREFFQENSSGTSGSMPKVNQAVVNSLPFPLPPAPEQKRIVAKVDQLMALCDELELRLNQAQHHSEKLVESTVRQLLVA